MTLEVVNTAEAWRKALGACRARGQQVGMVMTMGALHAGHMSLVRRAAAECDVVAVTDYVNPLQFAPGEDLASYPRQLEADCRLAAEAGAHLLFAPAPGELWPQGGARPATSVRVGRLGEVLEGASRPSHFEGVATVVTKLLSLGGRCRAYFGEKDYQQLVVVRRLVDDLSLAAEVVGCPTVRHPDGLALSSRNAYLGPAERAAAPQLYYALLAGKRAVEDDRATAPDRVAAEMATTLARQPLLRLDYAAVADPVDLSTPERIDSEVRLLIAARVGGTRLIDNLAAAPPSPADA